MPRRSNQKPKLLYLSKIFNEQTDEQHGLTLTEISSELEKYGIKCGRKCLYDDIEALRVFGMDIRTKRDRYVRYYVASGRLEPVEVKLLSDFLKSCDILPEKKRDVLIQKLTDLGIGAQEMHTPKSEELNQRNRLQKEEAYKNINLICRAIAEDRKISFKCFEWNSKKQRILVNGGELFCVSPQQLVFADGKYILRAFDDIAQKQLEFYPERMVQLFLTKQKRAEPHIKPFSGLQYENLRIRCYGSHEMAGEVFEHFGLDVTILASKDEYFEFAVKAAVDNKLFAWLFLQGGRACLLSPESVADEYEKMLKKALDFM